MKRLRLFAGLLGCLAILAASLSVVAYVPAQAQAAASEPCDHCPDCKGAPCPPALTTCASACVAASPALAAAPVALPLQTASTQLPSATAVALRGLDRPPDPYPPRA
ncbi:hypothetical protein RSO01_28900 [Reyranella soli]|uniref:Uncharacterized protein n=1 Tax=Reyranella soli TaxID=1230389 RepID=A0A512N9R8_9HYPH|nr:hypothetical protein RSO01_28900 [Reyranella soli]